MSKVCVEGVGINDSPTPVYVNRVVCPFYRKWKNMLYRCYSPKHHSKEPAYKDCTVCDEWLTFSNFKHWMEKQDWEGSDLDKDLLVRDNKVYSPETCCFLRSYINRFLQCKQASRGDYPLGVHLNKRIGKFIAQVGDPFLQKTISLGSFLTPEEAHEAWRVAKCNFAERLAALCNDQRVKVALCSRYEVE